MPAEQTSADARRKAAREVIDILHEIATLLARYPLPTYLTLATTAPNQFLIYFPQNTHLDRQQLSYCVSLIENGANPEALAVRA